MRSHLLRKSIAPLAVAVGVASMMAADPAGALKRGEEATKTPAPSLNGQAAIAVVSVRDQRISIYDADGAALRARISSGQTEYETPVGVFSVLEKKVEHYSNLYDDASMPFMQRLTWSGIALHAGVLPGYPASHGCVRLPPEYAERIFQLTKLGMRVVISRDDIAPVEIAHPLLLKPEPIDAPAVATRAAYEIADTGERRTDVAQPDVREWPARQALRDALYAEEKVKAEEAKAAVTNLETIKAELKKYRRETALIAKRERAAEAKRKADARVAKADKTLAEAKTPRAQKRAEQEKAYAVAALARAETALTEATKSAEEAEKIIAPLNGRIAAAEAAKTTAVAAAIEAKRKTLPVSVFVSAKSKKLYVRQGNEPVFDTEIVIAAPERPIGTHVFTALDFAKDGNDVKWNVVTISRRSVGEDFELDDDEEQDRGQQRKRAEPKNYAPPVTDAAAAAAALARVSIPADVRARISQYVWPGSSFIISDEDLSKETGKGTDFIVVASDEPQGALKMRKRQPAPSTYRDFYDDDYYSSWPYGRRRGPTYYQNPLFNFW